ncbi:hypothetical protein KR074_008741 [Drosophila pseudoananassae]|nr:hypothetical protein KR074_008741 [Drosophila pseudoananassae]
MLYYLVKFIKLCFGSSGKMFQHFRSLVEEWKDDRRCRQVNDVMFVTCEGIRRCWGPHQDLSFKCDDTYCFNIHVNRIIQHIDSAVYSIDLAIYALSSDFIGMAMQKASERGVRIRILCEKNFVKLIDSHAEYMLIRKIPPPLVPTGRETMMHHKFCIIDGYQSQKELSPTNSDPKLSVCMSGSLNWVSHTKSCDDLLICSSPKVSKRLEQEFNRIWKGCGVPQSKNHLIYTYKS